MMNKKIRLFSLLLLFITIFTAGCGGGGSDPTGLSGTLPVTNATAQENSESSTTLSLSNTQRAANSAPALISDASLNAVAQARAEKMRSTGYGHVTADGHTAQDDLDAAGISYSTGGENLAQQKTPQDAVNGWMASPSHRAALLSTSYTKVGIGVARSGTWGIYVQIFTD
jgi:uncharacterized protein YkwD